MSEIKIVAINEYELVYMYHQQSDVALTLLMNAFQKSIRNLIFVTLGYQGYKQQEDLYQIAHIKLVEAMNTYRMDRKTGFKSYYQRIIHNGMIDYITSFSRYHNRLDVNTLTFGFECCDGKGDYLNTTKTQVPKKQLMLYDEVVAALSKIDDMDPKLAYEIVRLRYLGYSMKEIEAKTKISIKKISYLFRKLRSKKDRID